MTSHSIDLHVYDLSRGMAANLGDLSQSLLGMRLEGIWHTGVYVYGREYFYGGGIQSSTPQQVARVYNVTTPKVHKMGNTTKTKQEFEAFLESIKHRFTAQTYDLFKHNCNNFSNEVVKFLKSETNDTIPRYILDLPNQVLSTPMGQAIIAPMFRNMQNQLNGRIDEELKTAQVQQPRNAPATNLDPYKQELVRCKSKYGPKLFDIMTKLKPTTSGKVQSFPEQRLHWGSITGSEDLQSFTTVFCIFEGDEDESMNEFRTNLATQEDITLLELDIEGVDSVEDNLETGSSLLEGVLTDEAEKVLVVGPNGSSLATAICLLHVAESLKPIGAAQLVESFHAIAKDFFIDFETFMGVAKMLSEFADSKFALQDLVLDTHPDSPESAINVFLDQRVNDILSVGLLNLTEDRVKRVLKTTEGNVDAAMNLLLQ